MYVAGRGGHAWGGGGVTSVAMATSSLQSVCIDFLMKPSQTYLWSSQDDLHQNDLLRRSLGSTLSPHSQTEDVKWEHVCTEQCAGCRW